MADDVWAKRANEVESAIKSEHGEEAYQGAMKGLTEQVQSGRMTQAALMEKLSKATAAGELFYDGMSNASESDWRRWRDAQPRRAERIRRAGK